MGGSSGLRGLRGIGYSEWLLWLMPVVGLVIGLAVPPLAGQSPRLSLDLLGFGLCWFAANGLAHRRNGWRLAVLVFSWAVVVMLVAFAVLIVGFGITSNMEVMGIRMEKMSVERAKLVMLVAAVPMCVLWGWNIWVLTRPGNRAEFLRSKRRREMENGEF